ncbi:DUF3177 family protein [Synechococcus sp. M16CYN]
MVLRLLTLYWKVASLMGISLLLLVDQRPLGYVTATIAPLLMVTSVWFWVDLNEELADQPNWKALPLTVRVWRWALSGFSLISIAMTTTGLSCMQTNQSPNCLIWLEAPKGINILAAKVFNFVFGGQWTEAFAAFLGYAALVAYTVGLLQWLLIRLPRYGRVAGEF